MPVDDWLVPSNLLPSDSSFRNDLGFIRNSNYEEA